jgi:hypothetical protein
MRVKRAVNNLKPLYVVLFAVFLAGTVYSLTPNLFTGGDTPSTAYLPASLLRHGTLRLDPYINRDPFFDLDKAPHWVIESQGHYYSKFSPTTSLLVTPIYVGYFALVGFPAEEAGVWNLQYILASRIAQLVLALALLIAIFSMLRMLLTPWQALGLTLIYAFATWTWPSAAGTLTTRNTGELFMTLGLLALLKISRYEGRHDDRRLTPIVWAGFCFSVAVSARPQTLIAVTVLSLYLVLRTWDRPIMWLGYTAGAFPVMLLLFVYNTWAFGAPWKTGYGVEVMQGWQTPLVEGLLGILVSPSHGLLIYSPALLLGWGCGLLLWLDRSQDDQALQPYGLLSRFLLVALVVQLLFISRWWAWHGGVAFNQRMLQEVHPLMLCLLALGFRVYRDRRWFLAALGLAAIWGLGMNVVNRTFYGQHLEWGERAHPEVAWSWRHLEILMYLRWHGWRAFVSGVGQTVVRLLLASGMSVALFWALCLRKPLPAMRRRNRLSTGRGSHPGK